MTVGRVLITLFLMTISSHTYSQGHTGAVDWTNDIYFLVGGNQNQANVGTQTWIGNTKAANAAGVTADAQNLAPYTNTPVGTQTQSNIYNVTSGFVLNPSPGPTSSSTSSTSSTTTTSTTSTSTTSTTTTGGPIAAASIPNGSTIVWTSGNISKIATIIDSGGRPWLDNYCHLEANAMKGAGHWTGYNVGSGQAVALVSKNDSVTDKDCIRSIYTAMETVPVVYTPASNNTFNQTNASITSLFADGPGLPITQDDGQAVTVANAMTGCNTSGISDTNNCNNWTDKTISYVTRYGDTSATNTSWMDRTSTFACANTTSDVTWYCAYIWGTSSSSTSSTSSSSTTTSGVAPTNDKDHMVWIYGGAGGQTMSQIASAVLTYGNSWFDDRCAQEAAAEGWGVHNVKAMVNKDGATSCSRIGDTIGAITYMPSGPADDQWTIVENNYIRNMFSDGPDAAVNRYSNGTVASGVRILSGCQGGSSGTNCNNWTVSTDAGGYTFHNTTQHTGYDTWIWNSIDGCGYSTSNLTFYCAAEFNASIGFTGSSSSSSSTSTTSSTSSGYTPEAADSHILWVANQSLTTSTFKSNGGPSWADGICQSEATSKGFPAATTARALISYGAMDCKTGLTGGSKVYQPTSTGLEEIFNGDWNSFFSSGPTTPANHDKDGNTVTKRLLTGCSGLGNHLPNFAGFSNGYNWNGNRAYYSIGDPTNWWVNNNASWSAYSGMSFYCAIDVNGSSGVTRSMVGGYPAFGDWVLYLTGSTFPKNTALSASGGSLYADSECQLSASNENYFDNGAQAKAIISSGTHSCRRPEFTGGSKVWTPNQYGSYDEIFNGDVSNVFAGSILTNLKDYQGNSNNSYFSGCDSSGNTSNNCSNWTDTTSTGPNGFNYTWSGTGSGWTYGAANQCAFNSSMRFMCAHRIQMEFQFP